MVIGLVIFVSVAATIVGVLSNVLDMLMYVEENNEEDAKIKEEQELLLLY
ncbi:Cytochrome C oxidase [Monkeypox virus]|uniref:IMV protein n=1 Tax=Monkeypox virus TaxID=10244 RepID=A0A0F7GAV8_MONPV|nr:IMV protein [Monkeypox virus]AKG51394.1 IMV protein [Monkeypox virus]QNI39353.1 IMV protein [Monkeypox virus]QNI39531.1 IMV protein [Monkeypox virus]QNI40285.1 IMV protein [Monkeypox virus]